MRQTGEALVRLSETAYQSQSASYRVFTSDSHRHFHRPSVALDGAAAPSWASLCAWTTVGSRHSVQRGFPLWLDQ